ncbi:hypothetical protein NPIL_173791 [Nephila pilipes]|uniref:Uncharacterized protein n=1 Tax=Nephila pilipes TaxID=299642 RepID=A0A8X6NC93_NEPPI|nr:hypothetical protein NPIL_173791 [Nephila pilipes]
MQFKFFEWLNIPEPVPHYFRLVFQTLLSCKMGKKTFQVNDTSKQKSPQNNISDKSSLFQATFNDICVKNDTLEKHEKKRKQLQRTKARKEKCMIQRKSIKEKEGRTKKSLFFSQAEAITKNRGNSKRS